MASKTDICNIALTHLGVKKITALTDEVEPARRLSTVYDTVLQVVLQSFNWNFATKLKALAELSGEKVSGWQFLYSVPSDCLFVGKVFNEDDPPGKPGNDFRECLSPDTSTLSIATDTQDAWVEYTIKATDPTKYSPAFVWALSLALAAAIAKSLTGDDAVAARLKQEFVFYVSEAKRTNASEGHITESNSSGYEGAR